MNKTIKSIYEAPDMMVQTMALGGMLCQSTGGLDQSAYGTSGSAGGNIVIEDGGSLF